MPDDSKSSKQTSDVPVPLPSEINNPTKADTVLRTQDLEENTTRNVLLPESVNIDNSKHNNSKHKDTSQESSPPPALIRRMTTERTRFIQALLTFLVPLAIAWFVKSNWKDFQDSEWDFNPLILIVACAFYFVSEGLRPLGWHFLMHSAGQKPPLRNTLFIWFAMEPLQYLPLPLGPFAGRYVLSERLGLSPSVALVTQIYVFALWFSLPQFFNLPALIWLAFETKEIWLRLGAIYLAFTIASFAYGTLREGGVSRTAEEAFGKSYTIDHVHIERQSLVGPGIIELSSYIVRITGAGILLSALTSLDWWLIPVYGLLFGAAANVPFGRFGTREAAITVALTVIGISEGPAALAAVSSRVIGLAASLLWLGIAFAMGGAKPEQNLQNA